MSALDAAIEYLAEDNFVVAMELLEAALDAARSLSTLSERGRVVPEYGQPHIREIFVRRYRLFYEVDAKEVRILAFVHSARDFERWRRGEK